MEELKSEMEMLLLNDPRVNSLPRNSNSKHTFYSNNGDIY
jgi:hypothetical protein